MQVGLNKLHLFFVFMEEFIKSLEQSYKDCDTLIDKMLKARVAHDKEAEMKVFRQMEACVSGAMQDYTVMIDFLERLSKLLKEYGI